MANNLSAFEDRASDNDTVIVEHDLADLFGEDDAPKIVARQRTTSASSVRWYDPFPHMLSPDQIRANHAAEELAKAIFAAQCAKEDFVRAVFVLEQNCPAPISYLNTTNNNRVETPDVHILPGLGTVKIGTIQDNLGVLYELEEGEVCFTAYYLTWQKGASGKSYLACLALEHDSFKVWCKAKSVDLSAQAPDLKAPVEMVFPMGITMEKTRAFRASKGALPNPLNERAVELGISTEGKKQAELIQEVQQAILNQFVDELNKPFIHDRENRDHGKARIGDNEYMTYPNEKSFKAYGLVQTVDKVAERKAARAAKPAVEEGDGLPE